MGLKISGLNELRERLERLRPEEVMARALAEQADRMPARVRDGLSEQPGAAGHDEPWLQSGALRDSVGAQADGLQAAVGSSDPAAVPQEMGTAKMPARPFLAPVAADMGEEVARAVGARVAAALRGDSTDGFDPSGVRLISESGEHPEDLGDVPPEDRRAVKGGQETPGQARAHGLPQIIPGLNSPFPTIPRLGGGRGPVSATPRPAAPSGQEATPAATGTAAEPARFGRTGAEYETLARDPAKGGKINDKTEQERRVGLELEKRGDVPGPITRDPTGKAEFIDAQGNKWDVKGFNSYFRPSKGGFNLQVDADKVDKSLKEGEKVMLDTSTMTPSDIAALKAEGAARGWGDKVVYWP